MKRIYLFFVLFIAIASSAFAQRTVDLQLVSHSVTNGKNFLAGGNKTDTITVTFKNLGPDSILSTDSIWLGTPLSSDFYWIRPKGLKKDSTFTGYFTFNIGSQGFTKSETQSINWCDSAYVTAKTGTTTVMELPTTTNNNKICNTVNLTIWMTSVNDVKISNIMDVYPNPANNNLNIKYNFGSSTSANVVIRDIIGKAVYTKDLGKNLSGEKEFSLDISSLASGMYMVELNTSNSKVVSKVNVQ